MNCEVCNQAMKPLFTSLYCPNDCGRPFDPCLMGRSWADQLKAIYPNLHTLEKYGETVKNCAITDNHFEFSVSNFNWYALCMSMIGIARDVLPGVPMDEVAEFLTCLGISVIQIGTLNGPYMSNWHLKL